MSVAPERIRTLVVDDEPLARDGVRMLLAQDPDIELAGEAGSGPEALEALRRLRPDLVMLDVQMPELNGFEVLARLAPQPLPAVIFVTAYDRYALRAFEIHALDYLLKPFNDERFHDALARAKAQLRLHHVQRLKEQLLTALATYEEKDAPAPAAAPPAYLSRLAIKDMCRVVFLDVAEIDWIEAADYYVQIHVGSHTYLHRETMQSLEERLDPAQFMRIHRSAIVNQARIRELRSEGRRELMAVLSCGVVLRVARSYREKFQHLS